MSDRANLRKWMMHAVVWRNFPEEKPPSRRVGEWAYKSPKYPYGIARSDLKFCSWNTQRDVITFWFRSNLEPHRKPSKSRSDPLLDDISAKLPRQTPMTSIEAIDGEFGTIVYRTLCSEIARKFPGKWV